MGRGWNRAAEQRPKKSGWRNGHNFLSKLPTRGSGEQEGRGQGMEKLYHGKAGGSRPPSLTKGVPRWWTCTLHEKKVPIWSTMFTRFNKWLSWTRGFPGPWMHLSTLELAKSCLTFYHAIWLFKAYLSLGLAGSELWEVLAWRDEREV